MKAEEGFAERDCLKMIQRKILQEKFLIRMKYLMIGGVVNFFEEPTKVIHFSPI